MSDIPTTDQLAAHVAKALASAPPLTEHQRQSIAGLLTHGGGAS